MKEKCLFCEELLEVEVKNLIASFDCLDHGWYAVSQRLHSDAALRPWALKSAKDLVPVILHHNKETGRAFPIPDPWVGRKVNVHYHDSGVPESIPEL